MRNFRAPLLWLLGPMITGFYLSRQYTHIAPTSLAIIALILSIIGLGAYFIKTSKLYNFIWPITTLLAVTFLFWAYCLHKCPPEWLARSFKPQETKLTVNVYQPLSYNAKTGKHSGYATVTNSTPFFHFLQGHKLYFQVKYDESLPPILKGTELQIKGRLTHLKGNPQNSFTQFLVNSGFKLRLSSGEILAFTKESSKIYQQLHLWNKKLENILRLGGNEKTALHTNTYVAMLLGKKGTLSSQQKKDFANTGTMHLFAISGLHVGVIAFSLATTLSLLRLPAKFSPILGLTLLFIYVQVTGGSPSAMRAFLMVAFFWSTKAFLRQSTPWTALIASAVLVLCINPEELNKIGFQLSYAVVASLLLFGVPLTQIAWDRCPIGNDIPEKDYTWKTKLGITLWKNISSLFCIALAAQIACAPLIVQHFQLFTPGGVFLNMLLVPLASFVIICGFVCLSLGLLGLTPIVSFLNKGAWVLLSLINAIIDNSLKIPGMYFTPHFKTPVWGAVATLFILSLLLYIQSSKRYQQRLRFYFPGPIISLAVILLAKWI